MKPASVVHIYNPNSSGGKDLEDEASPGEKFEWPNLN
jgi:hypothetical protein